MKKIFWSFDSFSKNSILKGNGEKEKHFLESLFKGV